MKKKLEICSRCFWPGDSTYSSCSQVGGNVKLSSFYGIKIGLMQVILVAATMNNRI